MDNSKSVLKPDEEVIDVATFDRGVRFAHRIIKIVIAVVILAWLVVPHIEQYQDGATTAWRAPTYIVVNYHYYELGIDKTVFCLFPYNTMGPAEIWDKCVQEEMGMSRSEIDAKRLEWVMSHNNG